MYSFFTHIFLFVLLFSAENQKDTVLYTSGRLDLIDHSGWQLKSEDSIWKNLNESEIIEIIHIQDGIWELSRAFSISGKRTFNQDIFLQIRGNFSALSVYINDSLTAMNGQFEENGNVLQLARMQLIERIPNHLISKQENELKLFFSTHETYGSFWISDIALNSKKVLVEREPNYVFQPLFIAGFLLLAICINVALFFAYGKQPVFIYLSLYFLCGFISNINQVIYWWYNPLIRTSNFLLTFIEVLTHIDKALLLLVLIHQFKFELKIKRYIYIYGVLFYTVTLILQLETHHLLIYMCLLSLYAVYLKRPYSVHISCALIVLLLSSYICESCIISKWVSIQNNSVFKLLFYYIDKLTVILFALVMLYTVSKQIFLQNKELSETKLKSAKLESQLVKKHIQPHFLINSLMSLQELIEEDKNQAGSMIEALSIEFHTLSKISNKTLIPIQEEIDLCRTHLKIMGFQQETTYELKTIGVTGNELIPPAIIHTLIENGLTHGYSGLEPGYFELEKITSSNSVLFRLFNNGATESIDKSRSGTGTKYVKARLEESFKGRWDFHTGPVKDGWESIITLRNNA